LAVIVAHAQEAPPPLESLRPDVPAELAALVARTLAKKPGDRPQTPKELADALTPFVKAAGKAASREMPPAAQARAARARRWPELAAVAAAALIAGALLAGVVLSFKTKDGAVTLQVDPPDAKVEVAVGAITVRPTEIQPNPNAAAVPAGEPGGAVLAPKNSEWAGTGYVGEVRNQKPAVAALTITERDGSTFKAVFRDGTTRRVIEGTIDDRGGLTHKVVETSADGWLGATGAGNVGRDRINLRFTNPQKGWIPTYALKRLPDNGAGFHLDGRWNCIYPNGKVFERTVNADGTWVNNTNGNRGTWARDGGLIDVTLANGAHEYFAINPENFGELNGVSGSPGQRVKAHWLRQ